MQRKRHKDHSNGLLRFALITTGIFALVTAMVMSMIPQPVSAAPGDLSNAVTKYPNINGTMLQQCSLCHLAAIPALNPYGAAYKAAGRNPAAFAAIESQDSDKDGFTNLQEIQSLTFPGDASSVPVLPTATKTPVPPTPTSIPPTATPIPSTPLPTSVSPTATSLPPTPTSLPSTTSAHLTCPTTVLISTDFTCTLSVNPAGASLAGLQVNMTGFNGLAEYSSAAFTALAGPSPVSLTNVKNVFVWAGSNGYLLTQSGDLAVLTFKALQSGTVNFTPQTKAANASNAPINVGINSVSVTVATTTETPKAKISGMAFLSSGTSPTVITAALLDSDSHTIASGPVKADGTYALEAPAGTYTLRISAPGYLAAKKSVSLVVSTPLLIAQVTLLAGDINADNKIDALDLISLGAAFEIKPALAAADLNGDGSVDLFDLTLLAKNWRKSDYAGW